MIIQREHIAGLKILTDENGNGKQLTTVYFEYRPITSFDPTNVNERKSSVVQLIELGYCDQKTAGIICNFHRNTVSRLLKIKRLLGIEAIFLDDRGPKGSWKYVDDIYEKIKALLQKHPDWTDQEIADHAANDLNTTISRVAVLRIRHEDDKAEIRYPDKIDLEELAKIAESIDIKQYDERQLAFNFEADPEFKQKVDQCSLEETPNGKTNTEKDLLAELKDGQRNIYSGMLFHQLFLNDVRFADAFDSLPCVNSTYTNGQICQTIFNGLQIGLTSIESNKLVNSHTFGLLLGQPKSPGKETIRERLSIMADSIPSKDLIDHFALIFLKHGLVDPEVFFIDGHFLPYYGLQILAKGYHTVRQQTMKGNEIYVITDLDKKPLFFITENCDIDFRPIIKRAAARLIDYGIERPILVFDRGGYGVHFFSELQKTSDFVTWPKYINKIELQDIEYTCCVICNGKKYLVGEKTKTIRESTSTAKKDGRDNATSMKVRMVVFKDLNTDHPMAIYTCNWKKSAGDIAFYMLSRWGDSENFFKEIMKLYNFNYHPGYDINELEQQPLIANPEVKTIKKTIKSLNEKIGRLVIEKSHIEAKLQKRTDKRLIKKIKNMQFEIDELQADIKNFTTKMDELPKEISIVELLRGKKMGKADLEKKKLIKRVN
jgi:regulator of replication initiation timing